MKTITLRTPSGNMPVYLYEKTQCAPLVILLMDAIGVRDELRNLARDLVREGYSVVLPNLYYRDGHHEDMDFSNPKIHETVMRLYSSYSHAKAKEDIGAVLESFSERPVGLLGFCMGGANALYLAGTFPDDIAAAAAIHPGGIATDAEDSPHRVVVKAKAELYIAIADEDPYADTEQVAELQSALEGAQISHQLEVYEGAHHGFAFASLPSFNYDAQQRYWKASKALFKRCLRDQL
ncbi:carboxymethylenebutenolidase [Litorivivens lipolytica]|uniref:Carboxymethylenebutenolidase n=1 Tax=Litorivivens lipolytica TaxID=1524264 RepID=A0A7W4Z6D8_9GAMM|nr:alpha/beta fold hydrolase [Litorivivens lipolytica]MBB3046801.1 carboxymethylenebutenolidase [Litorivivens lipolytica]